MKHSYFIAILLLVFMNSCSTDDSNNDDQPSEKNYFPLENEDFWTYDVEGEFAGRDSLYVANDTTISGNSYKKLKTKELPFGFFTSSLAENGIRKIDDKLVVSGSTNIDLLEGFPISLDVTDFVLFKENASDGQELSSIDGTFNYQYEEFPLTFNYTMQSVFQESLESFSVPNHATYQDVKVMKIIVNLEITSVFNGGGIDFPINILNPQNVVVSTQYYAANIGMIYSTTDINYILASDQVPVDIPSSGSQNIKEYLDTYNAQQ